MGSSNEEVETAAANNLNQDGDSNPSTEIQQVRKYICPKFATLLHFQAN